MKVGFIKTFRMNGASDGWSGTRYHISRCLEEQKFDVRFLEAPTERYPLGLSIRSVWLNRVLRRPVVFWKRLDPSVSRHYARQIERRIEAETGLDAVLCLADMLPIAYLKTSLPIVWWTDATFKQLLDPYYYAGMDDESAAKGHALESRAIANARLILYSSHWAAKSAVEEYGADPSKVKVVPYGANMESGFTRDGLKSSIAEKNKSSVCRLVFVGVKWERKGGDIAVQTCEELNRRGVRAELDIVGVAPPGRVPDFVKLHGFLNKADPAQASKIGAIYSKAHFFVLPTRADCTPIVLNEAAAFGLPALTTNVGGIADIVTDGVNGMKFDAADPAARYADYVEKHFADKKSYEDLSLSSFNEFETRLNWRAVGRRLRPLLEEITKR